MPPATKRKPLTAESALQELPYSFHYLVADGESKAACLRLVGLLLAQERCGTAADALETEKFIQGAKAQILDIKHLRGELDRLLQQYHFYQQHGEHAESKLQAAQREHEQAELALQAAQERASAAAAQLKHAKEVHHYVTVAESAIATRCEIMSPALSDYLERTQ